MILVDIYDLSSTHSYNSTIIYPAFVPFYTTYFHLSHPSLLVLPTDFTSGAELWLDEYEDETFEKQLEDIFAEIRPLYEQVHGYVRYRLRKHYGDAVVSEKGPIPMHLLGNMWAQQWSDIADLVSPFPDKPLVDVSSEMVKQGYTPLKMFQMGDDFFTSMNLTKLPQ